MSSKSDIPKYAAAILWVIVAIRHIIEIVDNVKVVKEYNEILSGYGGDNSAVSILEFEILIIVALTVFSFICAYKIVTSELDKYGNGFIVYTILASIIVIAVIFYLKSLFGSLSSLGSSFIIGGLLMFCLMYGSFFMMGAYCKNSDAGQRYDIKAFLPLLVYLGGLLCRVIFFSSESNGENSLIISGFVENLIWIGILGLTGLYIYMTERDKAYMEYARNYGYPQYPNMGYPSMGTMPGQSMGYPPMGMQQGQPMGYTSMGAALGQPMGYPPMGMPAAPVKTNLELAKEQSEREFILKKGGWICYNCKTANYSYVGTCPCGMTRDESEKRENADKERAIAEMNERVAKSREKTSDEFANADSEAADNVGKEVAPTSVLEASGFKEEAKTWECLSCHTVNDGTAKICKNCGQIKVMGYKNVSVVYCNSCGAMLDGKAKFCHVCGSKVEE
ncbi:MAG: zinc ribbon domain-containing protein [Lachnospiraceae bacterium]|nr:zinc ribbon domain-containing protein [Lachnospiraceae bacterium]